MAEILLSLTIIGVVATITLPSLTGNINERTWNTQRKALYARFSQAISLMPALNGYGTLTEDADGNIEDTAAETFVTSGLSKVLKINNICDSEHLSDCGIPTKLTTLDAKTIEPFPSRMSELNSKFVGYSFVGSGWGGAGSDRSYSYSQQDTKAAAFETVNGESIAVFYNPYCMADNHNKITYYMQPYMCANFIYDLNGNKGPNTVGKDIGFVTALYASDTVVVAPVVLPQNSPEIAAWRDAGALCKTQDPESRLPNVNEAMAMVFNQNLLGLPVSGTNYYWSSTPSSASHSYLIGFIAGDRFVSSRNYPGSVRCIKR